MNRFPQKNFISFALTVLFSFLAGVVGGLFGTGGGILIVFLLSRLLKDTPDIDRKDIFAMTVLAVAIMSISSLAVYLGNGAVTLPDLLPPLIPAAIGGFLGAFLLDRINTAWLNRIFAVLILYAGATLLFR